MNFYRSSSIHWSTKSRLPLFLIASALIASGQPPNPARRDLASCHVHEVTDLPGSHQFASDFIETMATDPDPDSGRRSDDPSTVFALTADIGSKVPADRQAIYLSKSINGGATWTPIARLDSRYFNAQISEGARNGLAVAPGATDFVITTQDGALQIIPQRNLSAPIVKSID